MNTAQSTQVVPQGLEQASTTTEKTEALQKATPRIPWDVRLRYALLATIVVSLISLGSFTLGSIRAMEAEFNGIHTNLLVRVQPLTQPQYQTAGSPSVLSEHQN